MSKDKTQQSAPKPRKFKTNHNGVCFITDEEFKEDEVKELSSEQLQIKNVKHALNIGLLIEVD